MTKSDSKENIPQNKQLYRYSRCLQYPTVEEMKYKEALEEVKNNFFRKSEYTVLIKSEETGKIMNCLIFNYCVQIVILKQIISVQKTERN